MSPRSLRTSVSTFFFIHGFCFASWASRIPNIQQYFHLSDSSLGSVLFAMPIGSFITLLFSGWLITKSGSRIIVLITAILYSCSLVGIGYASTVWQLVGCLFLFGFAGNMFNVAFNTQAIGVEALYKKNILSSFHGIWGLAGLSGAALGSFIMGRGISPSRHFLWTGLAGIFITFICSRWLLRDDINPGHKAPVFSKPGKSLFNLGMIAFCSMMCQGAMFDWSGVYFKKVLLMEPAWVGVGYTAFMICMTATRFIADWLAQQAGLKAILQWSGLIMALGLLLSVCLPFFIPASIGFMLIGIGAAPVVPLLFSAVGKSKTVSPAVGIAALSTLGFIGLLIGPPLVGFIAGAAGLRISFVVLAGVSLIVTLLASYVKIN